MTVIDPDCLACAACHELVGKADPVWVPGVGWCCPGCARACTECHRRTPDVAPRHGGRVLCWRCWELTLPP